MFTVLYIHTDTVSLSSLFSSLSWNTKQAAADPTEWGRRESEQLETPAHSLASSSNKTVALRNKRKKRYPSTRVLLCDGGCIHRPACAHTRHINFHFEIHDGCSNPPYEYVCVWRAFQCWAFSISNLLHVIMPDRFLHSVIWLLKTPKRVKNERQSTHWLSLYLHLSLFLCLLKVETLKRSLASWNLW